MTTATHNSHKDSNKKKRKSSKKKKAHVKKADVKKAAPVPVSEDAVPVETPVATPVKKASKKSSKKHKKADPVVEATPKSDIKVGAGAIDSKAAATKAATKEDSASSEKKPANNPRATISGPTMWASHQTYQFAAANLATTMKFVKQKLTELMRNVYGETDEEVIRENIALMLGEKAFKLRSKKDPNMPKRPLTGYQLWCRKFNKTTCDKPVDLIELSRLQSKKWRVLSEIDRLPFKKEAEQAKVTYKIALEVYQNKKVIITPVVARNKTTEE